MLKRASVTNSSFKCFKRLAANAIYLPIDDTGNGILNRKPVEKKQRGSDKEQWRTGIYPKLISWIVARAFKGLK